MGGEGEGSGPSTQLHPETPVRSPAPGHPRFFNQLFSGLDPHALAGRIITESLNTSQ